MRIVSSVSMAVAIGFVILRVYSRLWITRTFGKDDCKQPIRVLLYYAYCCEIDACVIAMVSSVGDKAQQLQRLSTQATIGLFHCVYCGNAE